MSTEFRVWLADGSEDYADIVMGVCSAEEAAIACIEDLCNDADVIVGRNPVIVHVLAENGARSTFEVTFRRTVKATAREVKP